MNELDELGRELPPYDVDAVEFRDAGIVIHFATPGDLDHPVIKKFNTWSIGPHEQLRVPVAELLDAIYHLIDEAVVVDRNPPDMIRRRSGS